jgi:hypothetical protein
MTIEIINGIYDEAARWCFKQNPSSTISWFLSASYAYYCRYESLLADDVFDKLCKYILDNYDKLQHAHKHLVTKEMLSAGSGYNLKESDYPLIVKVTTEKFIADLNLWRTTQ